jgi:hypothetical protein
MNLIRAILDWTTRLTSLAVFLILVWFLVLTSTSLYGRPPPPPRIEEVAGATLDEKLHLGDFKQLPGSALLYTALSTNAEKYGSSFGGDRGDRNLLFFDPASKKGHWLFPGNDQTIRSQAFLTDPPAKSGNTGRMIALLLDVEQPPKGDRPAQRRLAIADAEGRHVTTLADGIDDMLGWHQTDGQSVLVFYSVGGAARVIDYDIVGHAVRSDGTLSAE